MILQWKMRILQYKMMILQWFFNDSSIENDDKIFKIKWWELQEGGLRSIDMAGIQVAICVQRNDEFSIKIVELCIKNDEIRI